MGDLLFWRTVHIIATCIEVFVYMYIISNIKEIKSRRIIFIISNVVLCLTIVYLTLININPNLRLILSIILISLVTKFNYYIRIDFSMLYVIIYTVFIVGIDSILSIILIKLNGLNSINILLNNNIYSLQFIVITKIILISIAIILYSKKDNKIVGNYTKKESILVVLPLIANILIIMFIFEFLIKNTDVTNSNYISIIVICFMITISNLFIINIIIKLLKNSRLDYENKLMREKLNMQYQYYDSMQKNYSRIRELYHDMNNHILCIENLKNNDRKKYIDDVKKNIEEMKNNFYTKNLILDIILMEKEIYCKDNNIKLYVDLNFDKCNFIEMIDVCTIFSNLIDNAIEASKKIKDMDKRKIFIKGNIVNKYYFIKIKNNKEGKLIKEKNKIITTKKDRFLHGIGLESVKKAVEKYFGNMQIYDKENEFEIIIYIPIVQIGKYNDQISKRD